MREPPRVHSQKQQSSGRWLGLLQRRSCWALTLRGWLLLALLAVAAVLTVLFGLYPFLATTNPVQARLLVVEGWAHDHVMKAAAEEYRTGSYESLLVTGGPIEKGAPFAAFKTFAEFGAATVLTLSPDLKEVQAVPAPKVRRDRTFASAQALRRWLDEHGQLPATMNVVSSGAHSRRTRLLFQRAFAGDAMIGIISVADEEYEPGRWWASSQGFRIVIGETIAYLYVRLLFRE